MAGSARTTGRLLIAAAAAFGASCATSPAEPTAPAAAVQQTQGVAAPANAFGVDLYHRLRAEDGNVFISPTSISTAFAMLQAGAQGETARELAQTFHWPAADGQLQAETGNLIRALSTSTAGEKLAIANALWVQQGFPIKASFTELVRTHYGAEPVPVDFRREPATAADTINRWVDRNTNNLIRQIVSPADFSSSTGLVLTNTVYFKGAWARSFDPGDTHEGDFHSTGGAQVRAPMMNIVEDFRYWESAQFQAVELPYDGYTFTMVIFLPKRRDGLAQFEKSLTAGKLEQWLARIGAADARPVDLTLPKLRLEQRYQLQPPLSAMGAARVFSSGAELGGIADLPLKLDRAIHQTRLIVDERGTEAAAATALTIAVTGASGPKPPPVTFRADHPFFLLIRHRPTGAIVFLGRVERPQPG